MEIGLVGLGRMGGNMAERLRRGGHTVVGYDRSPDAPRDSDSLADLVGRLSQPRVVWVMVPAGEPTRQTIAELGDLLAPGDVVVDGGNSRYTDDQVHAAALRDRGVGYVDVGVSGGVWGLQEGYGLMAGGDAEHVAAVRPALDTLRPADPDGTGGGFVHAGPVGAGHFAKMVHNGIEYGLMQAYAEGYELLAASPLIENVDQTVASWRKGTVVRSWLLDLLAAALTEDPALAQVRGYAQDSGEGRWTVEAAIEHAVPLPVISAALFARFSSRQDDSPAMKVIAALRHQFGGHAVTAATDPANPAGSAGSAGSASPASSSPASAADPAGSGGSPG